MILVNKGGGSKHIDVARGIRGKVPALKTAAVVDPSEALSNISSNGFYLA